MQRPLPSNNRPPCGKEGKLALTNSQRVYQVEPQSSAVLLIFPKTVLSETSRLISFYDLNTHRFISCRALFYHVTPNYSLN